MPHIIKSNIAHCKWEDFSEIGLDSVLWRRKCWVCLEKYPSYCRSQFEFGVGQPRVCLQARLVCLSFGPGELVSARSVLVCFGFLSCY